MDKAFINDDKGREFEVHYEYYPGSQSTFDNQWGNWLPGDDSTLEIKKAFVNLYIGNKEKRIELKDGDIYNYFRDDELYDILVGDL